MRKLVCLFFILISGMTTAQPFIDIASFQHITLKKSGITNKKTNAIAEGSWDLAMINLPLTIDSSNVLVFSPSFEYRSELNDTLLNDAFYRTLYFPLTWVHTFHNKKSKLSLTGIYRYNADTRLVFGNNNDQIGIAAIYYHKSSEKLTWKTGLYYNQEFFHDQWIPFLGLDYHITDRLMIYSLLPRYFVADYTLTPSLHTGLWFRGIDESYRYLSNGPKDYFRVTEGYIRTFLDYYIPDTHFVITLAAGHTLQRHYNHKSEGVLYKTFPEGAYMLQAGIAFRFVTDQQFRTQRGSSSQ